MKSFVAICYNVMVDEVIGKKLDKFFSQFKQQKYKKGEILVRAGENPAGIYYLTEGWVKVYMISRKGDELIVNVYKPVSFFPMSYALNSSQNIYHFEAMTGIVVHKAPTEQVIKFLLSEPDVLLDLTRRILRGTDGLLLRMSYLMAGSAHMRLVTEILIQTKRFGKSEGGKMELVISEKDLAALSGMTRETVSREIKILKEKNIVGFSENKLTIENIKLLEESLDGGV